MQDSKHLNFQCQHPGMTIESQMAQDYSPEADHEMDKEVYTMSKLSQIKVVD